MWPTPRRWSEEYCNYSVLKNLRLICKSINKMNRGIQRALTPWHSSFSVRTMWCFVFFFFSSEIQGWSPDYFAEYWPKVWFPYLISSPFHGQNHESELSIRFGHKNCNWRKFSHLHIVRSVSLFARSAQGIVLFFSCVFLWQEKIIESKSRCAAHAPLA